MSQEEIKVSHSIKHFVIFLTFIWTFLSHSFVEEWQRDRDLGRPLSTWNWDLAFTPSAQEASHLPPALELYGRDRQTYLKLYKEYESSGFDFDLLKDRLQSAPFETENYQTLHARIKNPTTIFPRKVSIICPTHRPHDLQLVLKNFHRQQGVECELILLPNGPDYDLRITQTTIDEFLVEHPEHGGTIKVVDVPPRKTLGNILNIGISQATHDIVGRMDADDLYGSNYFLNMFREGFDLTNATIFGKSSIAFAFYDQSVYLSTAARKYAISYVNFELPGATQIVPKEVARAVPYRSVGLGEDCAFVKDIFKRGGTGFSTAHFDICILRNQNLSMHTWAANGPWKKGLHSLGDWSHIPRILTI